MRKLDYIFIILFRLWSIFLNINWELDLFVFEMIVRDLFDCFIKFIKKMWYVLFVLYIDYDNLYVNRIFKILFEDIILFDYMIIRKNMIL